jgi:hypothetical protein
VARIAPRGRRERARATRDFPQSASASVSSDDHFFFPRLAPSSRRYRARFNWEHYTHALTPGTREKLPDKTFACASVTSAFLQVRGDAIRARWIGPDPAIQPPTAALPSVTSTEGARFRA